MIFIYKIYVVGLNDTIDSIASSLGVLPDDIRKINGFSSSHRIKEGDQIIVPASNSNFTTYVIVKGDNLYEIAKRYNTTALQLQLLNGLADEYIYPGESLVVPNENVMFYITTDGDSLNKVLDYFGIDNVLSNQNIFLLPNQLIVYKS